MFNEHPRSIPDRLTSAGAKETSIASEIEIPGIRVANHRDCVAASKLQGIFEIARQKHGTSTEPQARNLHTLNDLHHEHDEQASELAGRSTPTTWPRTRAQAPGRHLQHLKDNGAQADCPQEASSRTSRPSSSPLRAKEATWRRSSPRATPSCTHAPRMRQAPCVPQHAIYMP